MMMMQSQIELTEAQADKAKAEAEAARSNTKTTEGSREALIEKLKQEGKASWLQNLRTEYENGLGGDVAMYKNKLYAYIS